MPTHTFTLNGETVTVDTDEAWAMVAFLREVYMSLHALDLEIADV